MRVAVVPAGTIAAVLVLIALFAAETRADCVHPQGNVQLDPPGDVNGSGTTNVADQQCGVLLALWELSGQSTPLPSCAGPNLVYADLDCDGSIEVDDALIGIRLSIGLDLAIEIDGDGDGCPDTCAGCVDASEGSCFIGGACIPEFGADPADPCSGCQPEFDATAYTLLPDGAACGPGLECLDGDCLPAAPDAPTGVVAVPGTASATVSWVPPDEPDGTPASYQVNVYADGGGPAVGVTGSVERNTGSLATAYTFSGLTNGLTYRFRVALVTDNGVGDVSVLSNAVIPVGVPGAPTGVLAAAGDSSATVEFTSPTNTGGAPIDGYVISIFPINTTVVVTESPASISGLANGQPYWFTVAATNAAGTGPASTLSNIVVPVGLPGAPTIISAAGQDGQIALTYLPPADLGGANEVWYVATCTSTIGAMASFMEMSLVLEVVVQGLTNGSPYTCVVSAANEAGIGPPSAPTNAVLPEVFDQAAGVVVAPPVSVYSADGFDGGYFLRTSGAIVAPPTVFGAATFASGLGQPQQGSIVAPPATIYSTNIYASAAQPDRTGAIVALPTVFGADSAASGLGQPEQGAIVAPPTSVYSTGVYASAAEPDRTGAVVALPTVFGAEGFDSNLGDIRQGSVVAPPTALYSTALYANAAEPDRTGAVVALPTVFGAAGFDSNLGDVQQGAVVAPPTSVYSTSLYASAAEPDRTGAIVASPAVFGAAGFDSNLGQVDQGAVVAPPTAVYSTANYASAAEPDRTGAIVALPTVFGADGTASGLGQQLQGAVVASPSRVIGHPLVESFAPVSLGVADGTVEVTLTGFGLQYVEQLVFYDPTGTVNAALTAGPPSAAANGTSLTATVTVAPMTTLGNWTVAVVAGSGISSPSDPTTLQVDQDNVFVVTN